MPNKHPDEVFATHNDDIISTAQTPERLRATIERAVQIIINVLLEQLPAEGVIEAAMLIQDAIGRIIRRRPVNVRFLGDPPAEAVVFIPPACGA